ncbi:MAG TPA: hypothetical protein PKD99_11940 [Sphingopyxis sp.]|nr:hypothetical protein [Sphingopyxis sp.]HMP45810.1 hypothetical protein [Sphingopyxis sp.]HMQ19972.1 hypothetical protein [Sphingopyxis sp.]
MTASALTHSILGEKRLIGPLLRINRGILSTELPRRVFRFAWHATAVLMLLSAAAVAWPGTPRALALVIGVGWMATGLFNAAYTGGRHIIWPFLTISGALAVIGAVP